MNKKRYNEQEQLEESLHFIVKGSLIFGAILIAIIGILEFLGVVD